MARRGIVLMELMVAGALLGTLLVVCLQLVAATSAQRRAIAQRQLALIEVGNVMERLAARPWSELTPQTSGPKLSPSATKRLPNAELNIEVAPSLAETNAKRIVVSLRWQDRAGQFIQPVRLVTWRWKGKDEK